MTLEILDVVAFLFVEQFDNLYGMLVDRTDVKRIRKSADDGEDGLFRVAASVFGDKLDDVLVGAANGAMDYIAYVDETWTPEDDEDRKRTLETEAFHLESLKAVLEAAGSSFDKAVKTLCFLTDMGNFAAFNEVYAKYFTSKPARSCVAVSALPKGVLVEVEVIAEL